MEYRDPVGAHRNVGIPVVGRAWNGERVENDDLAGVIFQECTFVGVRLERTTLESTIFLNSRFDDCVLEDCRVVDTRWIDCHGTGLKIEGGELTRPLFSQRGLERLDLEQSGRGVVLADLESDRVAFTGAGCVQHEMAISGCRFGNLLAENARWEGVSALESDLDRWSLDNAVFKRCPFIRVDGNGLDFSSVRFESCNLYQSEFREARFRWARGSIFAECELADADFSEADLTGALFAKSKAPGACFERARIEGGLFPDAVLTGARFAGAAAKGSVWTGADLTGADLERLDAYRSVFRNAVLADANVANARFVEADLHGVEETLAGADLRDSRGTVEWRAEREAELKEASG